MRQANVDAAVHRQSVREQADAQQEAEKDHRRHGAGTADPNAVGGGGQDRNGGTDRPGEQSGQRDRHGTHVEDDAGRDFDRHCHPGQRDAAEN